MIKQGRIIDATTGQGIPYASVEITDAAGTYLGAGVSADVRGNFDIDSEMMMPGTFMRISSVGYSSESLPYTDYLAQRTFALKSAAQTLPPVVVSVPATQGKEKNAILATGIGLFLLALLLKRN